MQRKEIIERIAWVPAWGISLISAFSVAFILDFLRNFIDKPLTYFVWILMNASASFLISILHPKKAWIVPLLCNILVLLPVMLDPSFWSANFGLIMGLGVVFSVIIAHIGAWLGSRRENRNTIKSG